MSSNPASRCLETIVYPPGTIRFPALTLAFLAVSCQASGVECPPAAGTRVGLRSDDPGAAERLHRAAARARRGLTAPAPAPRRNGHGRREGLRHDDDRRHHDPGRRVEANLL